MYKWSDHLKFECFLEKMDIASRYVSERGTSFGLIFKKKLTIRKIAFFIDIWKDNNFMFSYHLVDLYINVF